MTHRRTDEMRPRGGAGNVLAATGFLQGLAAEELYVADAKSK
jgi:hypothetical protein